MKRWSTPEQLPTLYNGVFNKGGIRFLIHKAAENGFEKCLRRIGKKIIIDLDEFDKWIDSHQTKDK